MEAEIIGLGRRDRAWLPTRPRCLSEFDLWIAVRHFVVWMPNLGQNGL